MQAGAGLPDCWVGERQEQTPLGLPPCHPATGLTTFPKKSKLWVVTSQRSTRKGLLKCAWGADVMFRDRGWETRAEAAPASVPRSLMSTVALCGTCEEGRGAQRASARVTLRRWRSESPCQTSQAPPSFSLRFMLPPSPFLPSCTLGAHSEGTFTLRWGDR